MQTSPIKTFVLGGDAPTVRRLESLFESAGLSAEVVACDELSEAVGAPAQTLEVMVLANGCQEDQETAEETVDEDGLPRWALFRLQDAIPSASAAVRLKLDEEAASASLLSVTLECHRLRRENLQMAGDFRSVSRRVCHDLRTPLSCVQTVLSVMEGGGHGALPDALIESASTSTQELARMVDQLAMLGRSWGAPSALVSVDMHETQNEAIRSLGRRLPATPVKLRGPETYPPCQGVLSWVEHVWETYLFYLLEKKAPDAEISVTCAPDAGGRVRFELSAPSARPVGSEELARVFLPFHLLAEQRGRGRVDFALAQRFLRLMDGQWGCEIREDVIVLSFSLRG